MYLFSIKEIRNVFAGRDEEKCVMERVVLMEERLKHLLHKVKIWIFIM